MNKNKQWALEKIDNYLSLQSRVPAKNALKYARRIVEQMEEPEKKLVHVIRQFQKQDMTEVSKDVFETEEEASQFAYDNYSNGLVFSYEVEEEEK